MKMIIVTINGADNIRRDVVFDTTDYRRIRELLKENNLDDYLVMDWEIRDITFYKTNTND
jgi:hypothetical protein